MSKKSKGKKKYDAAYLKAVEEMDKDRINEIKAMVKSLLEAIVQTERDRRKSDEKLAFLKADLEDIRHGRIEKLRKRREDDKQLSAFSPVKITDLEKLAGISEVPLIYGSHKGGHLVGTSLTTSDAIYRTATSGNFTLNDGSVVSITDKNDARPDDSSLRFA